ncbi:MAG: alpha/beta hydrolase [Sphingopyxis sp.]|nr:alpha/beta hydrolase [Sphingopyxis sp.]
MSGPETGRRVMLLHGTAAWSGFWRDVSAHLAAQGWRVIAVDTPPFGWSERDPQVRYNRVAQADRLAQLLRATGGPAIVVGHSFGAGAGVELAAGKHAGLVEGLVLVDAALGKLDPPEGRGAAAAILSFAPLGQAVTSASVTNPPLTGPLVRSFLARKAAADPWIETLKQPMRREGTTAAYAEWLPQLMTANDGAKSRTRVGLRAIRAPSAIIWGAADTVTPPAQGKELEALLKPRSAVYLAGVGHIPHIEDPKGFQAALDRSLAAVTRGQ